MLGLAVALKTCFLCYYLNTAGSFGLLTLGNRRRHFVTCQGVNDFNPSLTREESGEKQDTPSYTVIAPAGWILRNSQNF